MIIVCDNTDIAEVFFRKISGESVEEVTTPEEVTEILGADDDDEEDVKPTQRTKKPKPKTAFGASEVLSEFSNSADRKHTIRIDSKLLARLRPTIKTEQSPKRPRRCAALSQPSERR